MESAAKKLERKFASDDNLLQTQSNNTQSNFSDSILIDIPGKTSSTLTRGGTTTNKNMNSSSTQVGGTQIVPQIEIRSPTPQELTGFRLPSGDGSKPFKGQQSQSSGLFPSSSTGDGPLKSVPLSYYNYPHSPDHHHDNQENCNNDQQHNLQYETGRRGGRGCCGCFCVPKISKFAADHPLHLTHSRWKTSQTMSTFLRCTAICILILVPGIILRFLLPDYQILGIPPLLLFTSIATFLFILPFIHLCLHICLYHLIPESWYMLNTYGNILFYASEILWYISSLIWFLSILLLIQLVVPIFLPDQLKDLMQRYPLSYIPPILGVLTLWIAVLGVQKVSRLYMVATFNKNTFIGRVRETLFVDYIIEVFREAKRRVKYIRRMRDELRQLQSQQSQQGQIVFSTESLNMASGRWWHECHELKRRLEHLVVPQVYLRPAGSDDPQRTATAQQQQEESASVTSYAWKRLLDHFYSIVLQDDVLLDLMGGQDDSNWDEPPPSTSRNDTNAATKSEKQHSGTRDKKKQQQVPKLDAYHYLHHFGFESMHHRQLNRRRSWAHRFGDEKAQQMASKIFRALKRDNEQSLDIIEDILPLFDPQPLNIFSAHGGGPTPPGQQSSHAGDLVDERSRPVTAGTSSQKSLAAEREREEQIKSAVYTFFKSRGESERVTEKDLRQIIERSFRERRRLVESLSGMNSVVDRVNDFVFIILCLLLCLSTLSIFGVDAFGALLSFSSAFLSFAFLFGRSARTVFEGMIFILFTHPYDVGDRIIVVNNNYIVSKISLLNTTLERWDGQLVYMANSELSRLDILNLRRSGQQSEQIVVRVSWDTPWKLIEEAQQRLNAFAEHEGTDFDKRVGAWLDSTFDMQSLIVKFTFKHRNNWQNWELYLNRKDKMYRKCIEVLGDLKLKWSPLPLPVNLTSINNQRNADGEKKATASPLGDTQSALF